MGFNFVGTHSPPQLPKRPEQRAVKWLGGAHCHHSGFCQPLYFSSSAYRRTIHTLAKAREVKHPEILLSNKVIMFHQLFAVTRFTTDSSSLRCLPVCGPVINFISGQRDRVQAGQEHSGFLSSLVPSSMPPTQSGIFWA